ncbi:MAG: protein translocase subunit SecD [Candidatus Obscuribacterales bacterium]|nr:protein translocase subunit SecD [Steroidobacteraceae bacterium]
MHQFPAWRYWLVSIVLLLGLLLALPSVFDDADALQLTRNDRQAVDELSVGRVTEILKAKQVPVDASYQQQDRLVLRFDTAEQQAAARVAIEEAAPKEFLIALDRVSRMPNILRKIGLKPVSLGLDLRGGVYFLYEVDVAGAISQAMERLERDVRSQLRDKRIPFDAVRDQSGEIRVTLRDAAKLDEAEKIVRELDTGITVSKESSPRPTLSITMTEEQIKARQDLAIEQNIATLNNRVNQLGVSEPIVQRQGAGRIVVQLPGMKDPNQAIRVLGATATLEFRLVDDANDPYEAESSKRIPIGTKLYHQRDGAPVLLKRELIVSGDQLTNATTGFADQGAEVNVTLNDRGGKQMLAVTSESVGRRMAVVYKERKRVEAAEPCAGTREGEWCSEEAVVTAPVIQSVLSSTFRITGFDPIEAKELALTLRAGSLATSLDIVDQRTIGPTLGADNIKNGVRAMLIGMALTFIFMTLYYRAFGLIACVVLTANVVLLVAVMSLVGASLSLPGIAGIVLTVGMAADANVLIYERIREEIRNGNSPQAAIHAGFDKAFSAIADSNVTTAIAGIVLFALGSGPIKGFAVTLVIGIATSLFTAILGSRVLIQLIWGNRRQLAALPV